MANKLTATKGQLEKLYQTHSCAQIGAKYGVCAEIVRRKLHEYGIDPSAKTRRSFDPPKKVLEALYQTKSMREIAGHFGVGETVVFQRLKEHGITLKEHINHRLKTGKAFSESHKAAIRAAHRAKAAFGDKNPNWKGGLTEKNRRLRNSWQFRDWKQQSLERAEHKCERCGVQDGQACECCGTRVKLHVHHVKSFAKFPDLRFDATNSEVLCPKCHFAEHHRKPRELLESP
jgi:transposase